MLFEYFDCKAEGALIRKAVDASLDANVRTPEIQVEGGEKFGTKEVGAWIVDYIRKAWFSFQIYKTDNNAGENLIFLRHSSYILILYECYNPVPFFLFVL